MSFQSSVDDWWWNKWLFLSATCRTSLCLPLEVDFITGQWRSSATQCRSLWFVWSPGHHHLPSWMPVLMRLRRRLQAATLGTPRSQWALNNGKHIEREGENLRMIGHIPISLGNTSILMDFGCFVDFPKSHVWLPESKGVDMPSVLGMQTSMLNWPNWSL